MSRYLLVFLFVLAMRAQDAWPEYDFLIIVDTSLSMVERKNAAISSIRDLIRTSFSGQIESGDTVDVWSSETPGRGQTFTLQRWNPRRGGNISLAISEYISGEKFHRGCHLSSVMPELHALLDRSSGLLTFIITDGDEPISGFGFDAEISEEMARRRREASRLKRPFVICLAAPDGKKFEDFSVYIGGEKTELPRLIKRVKPEAVPVQPPIVAVVPEKVVEPEPAPPAALNLPPGARILTRSAVAVEEPAMAVTATALGNTENPIDNGPDLTEPEQKQVAPSPEVLAIKEDPAKIVDTQISKVEKRLTNPAPPVTTIPTTVTIASISTSNLVTLKIDPAPAPQPKILSLPVTARDGSFVLVYSLAGVGFISLAGLGICLAKRPSGDVCKRSFISQSLAK